jgi:peptidoglycan/xylan/chitin deacetylase (PgdA/CDA1 family)
MALRLDRLATLGVFWPVARAFPSGNQPRIPILMYHSVRDGSSGLQPYYETNVSPQTFASQMRQLRDEGYLAVTVEQGLEFLRNSNAGQKFVVITFDDGYRDFYEAAFPVLLECGFGATVFLITGRTADKPTRFKNRECLTWTDVRELHSRGITFGSHTATHPELKFLSMEKVEDEVAGSKKTIEDHIGAPVRSFSYPYAFPEANQTFVRQLKVLLQKCGYDNGVTTILGTASALSDRFFLPRLPINTWDDPRFFRAKLEGGYDWLHSAQYLYKQAQRMRRGTRTDRSSNGRGEDSRHEIAPDGSTNATS